MRKSLHFKQRLRLPGEGILFYSDLAESKKIEHNSSIYSYTIHTLKNMETYESTGGKK